MGHGFMLDHGTERRQVRNWKMQISFKTCLSAVLSAVALCEG